MKAPEWDQVDLTDDDLDEHNPDEQMGTKIKNWVRLPGDPRRWLIKVARPDELDGVVAGEDWAEWVVHHLATLIGVPTAVVRPATFNGSYASVSRSMLSDDTERLEHGNSLLEGAIPEYRQAVKGESPDYTPENVRTALRGIAAPRGFEALERFDAYDVWAGYIAMDALFAGQDRHDENWAVIRSPEGAHLAPSFDHGNALGFLLRDEKRQVYLDDANGVLRWAERGGSRHFAGQPRLVKLAQDALALASSGAQAHWLAAVRGLDFEAAASVLGQVPDVRMSDVGRTFILRLLETNQRRLFNGY